MTNEAVEVKVARMEERLKMLVEFLENDRDHQLNQRKCMESIQFSLLSIEGRVEKVEERLATASPTIDEFVAIKHKVMGAGVLGKWVWAALGAAIGLVYSARESILAVIQLKG